MAVKLDTETLDRLKKLPPEQAFRSARDAVYASGPVGSEDFVDLYEQLVEESILTWDEVAVFEGQGRNEP